jgi:AcrR family transcriptional regulator
MAGFTKKIILQTLMALLDEKPLAKITVKDIVERCGINRNTFYYYFKDIPDAVEYVLKTELDKIINTHLDLQSVVDGILLIIDMLEENKKAMLHIYRSIQRETFLRYLEETSQYVIEQYVENSQEMQEITEENRTILIRMHKCLLVGTLLDWIEHAMNYDLAADMKRLEELYGNTTEKMLERARA